MDFSSLNSFLIAGSLPSFGDPFSTMFFMIAKGGWIAILVTLIWGGWTGYLEYIRNKFDATVEFVLLAIDVPKINEQSPKAVEHMFSHMYGILKRGNLKERYLQGYTQMGFSLEIVSIEGYIQFLIRTPLRFRDLVEAAVYAQYPEAEITEVEDYIDMIPRPLELPHPEWDIWGSQIKLINNEVYPIRTYPFFEHSLTQKFMDPMASMLELMSRMGPGEQLWMQIIIAPAPSSWKDRGVALINKLIGKKDSSKKGTDWTYFPREISKGIQESFTASIIPPTEMGSEMKQKGEREWPSMMQHLSPAEREIVESVGMKISKLGFLTKIRFIYSGKKNIFNKDKGVEGFKGSLMQFNTQNLNGFDICRKTRTKIDYFFIKRRTLARKRRILWGYRYRSMKRGRKGFILNTEELASIWHFPVSEVVKVPSVQTVGAKKGQAPIDLPTETPLAFKKSQDAKPKGAPPSNLPV